MVGGRHSLGQHKFLATCLEGAVPLALPRIAGALSLRRENRRGPCQFAGHARRLEVSSLFPWLCAKPFGVLLLRSSVRIAEEKAYLSFSSLTYRKNKIHFLWAVNLVSRTTAQSVGLWCGGQNR